MGSLVSNLNPSPSMDILPPPPRPSHIPIPVPDDSFPSPPPSPDPPFYTAPSSPQPSPLSEYSPSTHNSSSLRISAPPAHLHPQPLDPETESFPTQAQSDAADANIDLSLDDDGLTTLEKIYLFSRSNATFHRVFIAHALPSFLNHVTSLEAIQYVLPLLSGLAMDEDDQVKQTLADQLVSIIWWFFSHCQLVEIDPGFPSPSLPPQDFSYFPRTPPPLPPPFITVQSFTPILGTLLLSPSALVGARTRLAIVQILGRMHEADDRDATVPPTPPAEEGSPGWYGLFGPPERQLFEQEIIHQVVIGMGHLDVDEVIDDPQFEGSPPPGQQGDQYSQDSAPQFLSSFSSSSSLVSQNERRIPTPIPSPTDIPSATTSPSHAEDISWVPPSPRPHHATLPQQPSETPYTAEGGSTNVDTSREDVDDANQAAVGRLSSMSLMAAVTAGGTLTAETKSAFVTEVERVGHDQIFWVRREAAFTLGALAKVVPEEVVISSLLPLFESLTQDTTWHVRHSALFALPAILSRLPLLRRRSLALRTVLTLSQDESPGVRLGVLEALGEVIYTFHNDDEGPPEDLVQLFIGREDNRRGPASLSPLARTPDPNSPLSNPALEPFFTDAARPLVCAFNIPAVTLTLGRARWPELRGLYRSLAAERDTKVRRTLAASVGELAKIVGYENAAQDLVPVWWDAIRCEEDGDVRMKAVECVETFVGALIGDEGDAEAGVDVVEKLERVLADGGLKGWREREALGEALTGLAMLVGAHKPEVVRSLLTKVLDDVVAAVREVGIAALPKVSKCLVGRRDVLRALHRDIRDLSASSAYRKRMTFVACHQTLILARGSARNNGSINAGELDGADVDAVEDEEMWKALVVLADDHIPGVRIGVARLVGIAFEMLPVLESPASAGVGTCCWSPSGIINDLVRHLLDDPAQEVRSYVSALFTGSGTPPLGSNSSRTQSDAMLVSSPSFSTFSRPPPSHSDVKN